MVKVWVRVGVRFRVGEVRVRVRVSHILLLPPPYW